MMRFAATYCKSAGYSEFQARLIAAICDQLGLVLLREVPRVELHQEGGPKVLIATATLQWLLIATSKIVISGPCN